MRFCKKFTAKQTSEDVITISHKTRGDFALVEISTSRVARVKQGNIPQYAIDEATQIANKIKAGSKKPPLGLCPYSVWRESLIDPNEPTVAELQQRKHEIQQAIDRYTAHKRLIPQIWVSELEAQDVPQQMTFSQWKTYLSQKAYLREMRKISL